MAKIRKMLGSADSPYIISLMGLIETQSQTTIANWCMDYAEEFLLPVYESIYPEDTRLQEALNASRAWQAGELKLPVVKRLIQEVRNAAREAEENPAAQAAARAVGQAAASVHTATNALGIAFYGAAAVAYSRVGTQEEPEIYEAIAAEECAKMEAALRTVSIEDEENPARINWYC